MSAASGAGRLPESTRLGPVELLVTDAGRSLSVWKDVVGLSILSRDNSLVTLGLTDKPMVILHEGATAPRPAETLGLFHVAIHVPARRDLAMTARRAREAGLRMSGQDHLLTESIYFADPDANGIEIAFETPDRGRIDVVDGNPRAITRDGTPHTMLEPLDVSSLLTEAEGETPDARLPGRSFIGHIHFRTVARDKICAFYADVIGFHPRANSATFKFCDVGTRARPHTVAFNSWGGDNLEAPPPGTAGVLCYAVELPSSDVVADVRRRVLAAGLKPGDDTGSAFTCRDPENNAIRLVSAET